MPGTKRPTKRYRPKHIVRDGGLHTIARSQLATHRARLASSAAPLDATQVRDLAVYCHSAIDALRTGEGVFDHTNHLALACNVSLVLCEQGFGEEYLPDVFAAQEALVRLLTRAEHLGRYVLAGRELEALNRLLELHEAQLEHEACTEGLMVRALGEIKRRMSTGHVLQHQGTGGAA